MNRRRIIKLSVLAAATAFIFAVQRDTFLRRWLLPAPPDAAALPVDLERRVPALRLVNGNIQLAAAAMARVSGMAITVDEPVTKAFEGQYISLDLRDATVDDVMHAIPRSVREPDCRLMLVRRGDAFILRRATDATVAVSIRMYDIDALLPTTAPPPVSGGLFCGVIVPGPLRTPLENARWATAENIAEATKFYLVETTERDPELTSPSFGDPVFPICVWANHRLIVIAPEVDQARAAAFLLAMKEPSR